MIRDALVAGGGVFAEGPRFLTRGLGSQAIRFVIRV